MPKAGMETNIGEVYQQFLDFNQKEMRQALRGGITNAANQLRSVTKRNVRAMLPAARNHNPRFDDTMLDAVKRSKIIETKKRGNEYESTHYGYPRHGQRYLPSAVL
jgi:hypothetical protein